jgi:hypothetical protein
VLVLWVLISALIVVGVGATYTKLTSKVIF